MSELLPISASTRAMDPVTATAGQVQFPYGFPAQAGADVRVTRARAGVATVLAYPADYSVQGVGSAAGGTVTLAAGSLAGDVITVDGLAVMDRTSSVAVNGRFSSTAIDGDFNRALFRDQELRRDVDRAITQAVRAIMVPVGETAPVLPAAALRRSTFLGADASGAIQFFPLPLIDGATVLDFTTYPSRTLLSAANDVGSLVALDEDRRFGLFRYRAGNYAAEVAADPAQGVYIAPASDPSGATGCWVREDAEGRVVVTWFGALMNFDTGTLTGFDDGPAQHAALQLTQFRGAGDIIWPAGTGYVNTRAEAITASSAIDAQIMGQGERVTTIYVGPDTRGFLAIVNTDNYNAAGYVSDLRLFLMGQADATGNAATVSVAAGSATLAISHAAHGRAAGDVAKLKLDRAIVITGASNANPCVITAPGHGLYSGDYGKIGGVAGMTQLNGDTYQVTRIDANTVSLNGVNSTGYGVYSSGGTITADCVGGIRCNGEYRVASVPDANSYTITARANGAALSDLADATVATPVGPVRFTYPRRGLVNNPFQTVLNSRLISVKIPGHGQQAGDTVRFWTSTTVNGLTVKWTYPVVSVTDADVFTIRDERSSNGASATSAGWEGGSVEYQLLPKAVIKINNRPGGGAVLTPRAVIERVSIDSAPGGAGFAHLYVDLLGMARPEIRYVHLQGRNGDRGLDLGGQQMDAFCGFHIYDCYSPSIEFCRAQKFTFGGFSAANNSAGEGTTLARFVATEVNIGFRRECRSKEPGFSMIDGHINYRGGGLELDNCKNGDIQDVLFYCNAYAREVPELARVSDVAMLNGTYDIHIKNNRHSFTRDVSGRVAAYIDTATDADASFAIEGNRFEAAGIAPLVAVNVNAIRFTGNDIGKDAAQSVSIGGVNYHSDVVMYKNSDTGTYKIEAGVVISTASKTVAAHELVQINNKAGAENRMRLPDPATCNGRVQRVVNWKAFQVTAVDALNVAQNWVVPLAGGAATSVICPAGAGKWVLLHASDGLWYTIAGVV